MDRFDRIYRLHRVLRDARYPVPHRKLQEKLECSRATINRIIEDMRNILGAPIEYDRQHNGYHYAESGTRTYELPGLWFNAEELHALLSAQRLLTGVQPGLLDRELAPLRRRIETILRSESLGSGEIARRVRIISIAARHAGGEHFQSIAGAVTRRIRLRLRYHGRARDTIDDREVSPQRLVHYRDNWYLDAWCHARQALRSFALERILAAETLDMPALEIADVDLDAHFSSSYGIFAGPPTATAVLRFTPERARWVADEQWHPAQEGCWLEDGYYELRIPYGDSRELIMDILKYGPEVEVMGPEGLREEVVERLRGAIEQYGERG